MNRRLMVQLEARVQRLIALLKTGTGLTVLLAMLIILAVADRVQAATKVVFQDEVIQEQQEEDVPEIDMEMQRKVRVLQRQLNVDDVGQRDAAEAQLLTMGPQALDYLPTENVAFSAELNGRLRRVRVGLEMIAAIRVTQPLSATLKGTMTLKDALEALSKQTENSIAAAPPFQDKEVTVDWKELSFWEAVDALADQVEGDVQAGIGSRLYLTNRIYSVNRLGRADYQNGFRISPSSIRSYRNLLSDTPSSTTMTLSMAWEPRLRLIRMEMPMSSLRISDANGKELLSDAQAIELPGKIEFGIGREQTHADIPFDLPNLEGNATGAIQVSGEIKALVAGRQEVFRFENLGQALKQQPSIEKSGITVKLVDKAVSDHLMMISINVKFSDAKKSLESHLGWVYENPATLILENGERSPNLSIESGGQQQDSVTLIYLFDNIEELDKCVLEYKSPGILVETDIPFTLKGVKLP